jgi:hypothetical protein
VEDHVAAGLADLLVAAEQALALVARRLGDADRGGVPRLDVELDSVQFYSPGEGGQRP